MSSDPVAQYFMADLPQLVSGNHGRNLLIEGISIAKRDFPSTEPVVLRMHALAWNKRSGTPFDPTFVLQITDHTQAKPHVVSSVNTGSEHTSLFEV